MLNRFFKVLNQGVLVGLGALAALLTGCSPTILSFSLALNQISLSSDSVVNDGITPIIVSIQLNSSGADLGSVQDIVLSSNRGLTDTIVLSEDSSLDGIVSFKVTSQTLGSALLSASVPNAGLGSSIAIPVLFLSQTPWTDYQAQLASGLLPGIDTANLNSWTNLNSSSGLTLNGLLTLFGSSESSGWTGAGSTASPYALSFDSSASNAYVDFGNGMNNPSTNRFSFETWIAPSSVASSNLVILGNGTTGKTSNVGLTLKQSNLSPGAVQLTLGDRSYEEEILSNLPTSYWKLTEGTGTGVDSSGNSNPIIYSNTSAQSTGSLAKYPNGSTVFNGTNSYVQIPATSYLNVGSANFTINFNAYSSSSGSGTQYLFSWSDPSNIQFLFYLQGATIVTNVNGGATNSVSNVAFPDQWHQYTITKQSNNLYIFVDGVGWISLPIGGAVMNTGTAVYFGSNLGSTSNVLTGAIDNISFYPSGVSFTELAYLNKLVVRPTCVSSTSFLNNIWHFLSGSFDGAHLTLSVDGIQECSIAGSGTYGGSVQTFRIGADSAGAHAWSGRVADLRTYQTALTPAQVNSNYEATQNRF